MPVRVFYFADLDLRWVRYGVTLTMADVIAVTHHAYRGGNGTLGRRSFIDLEEVETVEVTFSDMNSATQTAVEALTAAGARIRAACHAPADVGFGISRIYQTLMENSGLAEILVTRERDDVAPFLGLEVLPDLEDGDRLL